MTITKGNSFICLVFCCDTTCDSNSRHFQTFIFQFIYNISHSYFHTYCWVCPFVHHFIRAVTTAAASTVKCNHIYTSHSCNTQNSFQVFRVITGHFEVNVFQTHSFQFFHAVNHKFCIPQWQSVISIEVRAAAFFKFLFHFWCGWVRSYNQTAGLFFQCFFITAFADSCRLYAFCRLSEFKFDSFTAVVFDCIFWQTLHIIFYVALQDNLTIATIVFIECIKHFAQHFKFCNFAVCIFQIRVFTWAAFADNSTYTGHSSTCKVVFPVQFDNCRQHKWQCNFNFVVAAISAFQFYIVDCSIFIVWSYAVCAKAMTIDIEM